MDDIPFPLPAKPERFMDRHVSINTQKTALNAIVFYISNLCRS
jgi:hypothetical protein